MSAYMMDKEDIDRIIHVAVFGPCDAQEWRPTIQFKNAADFGEMLVKENLSSIHFRYPETATEPTVTPGPSAQYWLTPYTFATAEPTTRDQAVDLIRCYQYQSCEHPEWEASKARVFTDALRGLLLTCPLKPLPPTPPKPTVVHYSITETAKIIRAELKKAFPDTKFSVRSQSYSMGCHIQVSYTDGPPSKAVESITNQFYGTGFDGMTDSTTYHDSTYNGKPAHFAGSRPSVSRAFTGETIINDMGRSVCNPDAPQAKIERMLQERIGYSDDNRHYLPHQNAWQVIQTWDARWETLERAVERYLCENVHGYMERS